jgi:hypothetical protein
MGSLATDFELALHNGTRIANIIEDDIHVLCDYKQTLAIAREEQGMHHRGGEGDRHARGLADAVETRVHGGSKEGKVALALVVHVCRLGLEHNVRDGCRALVVCTFEKCFRGTGRQRQRRTERKRGRQKGTDTYKEMFEIDTTLSVARE